MSEAAVWMRCKGCARWFYGAFSFNGPDMRFCVLCTPCNQAQERTRSPVLRKAS